MSRRKRKGGELETPLTGQRLFGHGGSNNWRTVGQRQKIQIDDNNVIGKGGFGKVFCGKFNGNRSAVKRIFKDERYTSKEIHILEKSSHPNIVQFFFHDEDDDFFYVAMEKCNRDLHDYLEQTEENLSRDADIMHQATSGLCYLHSKGVIHRDIKLCNILVNVRKHSLEVKLTDFGISKILQRDRTSTSTAKRGSEEYQASEVLRGLRIKKKSDVFSLGIVFHKILLGVDEHPFGNDSLRIQLRIRDKKEPLSEVSTFPYAQAFRDLIASMIEHDVSRRYSSTEVEREIDELRERIQSAE